MSVKTNGFITKYVVGVVRIDDNAILEDFGHNVGVIDGKVIGVRGDLLAVYNEVSGKQFYMKPEDVLEKSDEPVEIKVGM